MRLVITVCCHSLHFAVSVSPRLVLVPSGYLSGYLPRPFFLSYLFPLFPLSACVILRDSGIYILWTRLSHGSPSFSLEYTFRY